MVYFVPMSCWAGSRGLPPGGWTRQERPQGVGSQNWAEMVKWVWAMFLRRQAKACRGADANKFQEQVRNLKMGQGSGRRWQHGQRTGSRLTRNKEDLGQLAQATRCTCDLAFVSWVKELQTQNTSFFCSQKNKPSQWRQNLFELYLQHV